MKKIYKYPTGAVVPEGAIFLSTIVEEPKEIDRVNATYNIHEIVSNSGSPMGGYKSSMSPRLVWHYFLVEVTE